MKNSVNAKLARREELLEEAYVVIRAALDNLPGLTTSTNVQIRTDAIEWINQYEELLDETD